jgi:hypothetical protein
VRFALLCDSVERMDEKLFAFLWNDCFGCSVIVVLVFLGVGGLIVFLAFLWNVIVV